MPDAAAIDSLPKVRCALAWGRNLSPLHFPRPPRTLRARSRPQVEALLLKALTLMADGIGSRAGVASGLVAAPLRRKLGANIAALNRELGVGAADADADDASGGEGGGGGGGGGDAATGAMGAAAAGGAADGSGRSYAPQSAA